MLLRSGSSAPSRSIQPRASNNAESRIAARPADSIWEDAAIGSAEGPRHLWFGTTFADDLFLDRGHRSGKALHAQEAQDHSRSRYQGCRDCGHGWRACRQGRQVGGIIRRRQPGARPERQGKDQRISIIVQSPFGGRRCFGEGAKASQSGQAGSLRRIVYRGG